MQSELERVRAERSFKKQQKELEAGQAWRELAAEQASTAAKTARLRALRLARDATEKPVSKPRKVAVRAK